MDKQTAIETAKTLVGETLATQIAELLDTAAPSALTFDKAGRKPGEQEYQPTYDPYWLAAEAITLLAIQQAATNTIQHFTSEGASFTFTQPDLLTMATKLRERSQLAALYQGHGLGIIELDGSLSDYTPTSHSNHLDEMGWQ